MSVLVGFLIWFAVSIVVALVIGVAIRKAGEEPSSSDVGRDDIPPVAQDRQLIGAGSGARNASRDHTARLG